MHELRQSTARTIIIGPFLDDTDGKTPETALDVTTINCDLYKGSTKSDLSLTASGGDNDCVHVANGYYSLELTTGNSDTLANGRLSFNVSGVMPFWEDFMVVSQQFWDSKYSTDVLQVDVTQWLGTAVATPSTAGVPEVEIKPITHCSTSGTVNVGSVQSGVYTNACTDDTSYWQIDPSFEEVDVEFGFGIGVNRIPTNLNSVLFVTFAHGATTTTFYAYNYLTSSWDTLNYSALGSPGTSDTAYRFSMIQDHVDTDGSVKIRVTVDNFDAIEYLYIDLINVQSIDAGSIANGAKLGAQGMKDVNAEADTALSDYDGPTNTEMVAAFTEIKGGTWGAGTDTLEHIRDKQTDIETDTAEIGTAGAGLTDLGGMSTGMKAEIESEANDALVVLKLDHLVAIADSDDPVNDSIISKLAAGDGDWSGYDKTTDSLEAIRNRGDTSWVTGAGGSDRLLMVDTTIATLASQTSFTLTAGSADDDAYHNCTIVIEDSATSTQKAVGLISAYAGATKTVTLKYDPAIFTMATTDKVYILAENALKATLANRQLNVAADGDIAGNVDGSVASVVGAVGSVTGAVGSVTGNVGGNVAGSTGSVTGSVGSVTGNVGGNVTGSVGSVIGAAGSVTGNVGGNVTGSVGSVIGHTAQTGDTYALANGASGFANIIADTNELQTDWENGGRLDLILDTVKVKTDNLPDGIKKNTAITAFTFLLVQSSDHVTGATGLTVAGSYSGDGGVVTALTNTGAITEISNGLYEIDLTAGELNYENVTLIFTAAGANTRVITIHTST